MLNPESLLDETGWRILSILQHEARISYKALGKRIGLTGTAVAERVRRMEDEGIIEGYGVRLNLKMVGLPVTAFFKLRANAENCKKLRQMIKELPEIIEAHRVVGNEGYVLKVVLPSMERLEVLLEQFLPLGPADISIVLSTPVQGKPVEKDILRN